MATTIQFLRSDIFQERPDPAVLANGTPMVNFNQNEPGLFFKARDGSLFKVGPAAVGPEPPNSGAAGYPGNTKGEIWLDTSNPNAAIFNIWDGSEWIKFVSDRDLFRDVTVENSLTVEGPSYLDSIVDGFGSPGLDGQFLTTNGQDLRWSWIRTENTIYVAKNGEDGNDGLTPLTPKLTIKAALSIVQPGDTILVASGDYREDNPLFVPERVGVEGADLRTTTIYGTNNADLFHVSNGCYIAEFSFRSDVTVAYGTAAVGYAPQGAGNITRSPYVQNCTNFIPNSVGLKVDGSRAGGLRSMVLDSYTQFNPNGIGAYIFNQGYAQLVSMFTICTDKAVLVESGGTTSITNSNSDFGNFGLFADGVGPLQFSGEVDGGGQLISPYAIKNLTSATRPYVGQVVTVGGLFYRVREIEITDGGVGYTVPPDVFISIGTGPNAIAAQGIATIAGGQVTGVELISSGQNYTFGDVITVIFTGGGGGGGAAGVAIKDPIYYTVESATPVVAGSTSITLVENLPYVPSNDAQVDFFPVSSIISNSHCFEYIGSGTDIQTCLPALGGIPIQANEVVQINGGKVAVTSTDQLGNFRVGEGLVINQTTGTISGTDFTKSILATVTPYILALS